MTPLTDIHDRFSQLAGRRWIRYGFPLSALVCAAADPLLFRQGLYLAGDMAWYGALFLGFSWILIVGHAPLSRWLTVRVDARFLPFTRVVYALICLYAAVQHLWAVRYAIEPSNFDLMGWPENKPLAYALNALYFAALFALLAGRWLRAAWVVMFLVGGVLAAHTLEGVLKIPLNFFAMFVSPALWRGDRSAETPWCGWPLLVGGLCMVFTTAGAGFFKLIDPVWQHGTGFYYSLAIPFFSPKHLWPLLDSWPLVIFCNWSTIIVECLALPLFLIRRTRTLGVLCIAGLGVFLSWPMWGIGLVGGPVLLAFLPAWAGLCPPMVRWWHALRWIGVGDRTMPVMSTSQGVRPPVWVVLLTWYTLVGFTGDVLDKYRTVRHGVPVYGMFEYKGPRAPLLPRHLEQRVLGLSDLIYRSRPDRMHEMCWLIELFDYHHLFERVTYRVRVEGTDGHWHTVDFFDADGAMLFRRAVTGYAHTLEPVSAIRLLRHRDRQGASAVYGVRTLNDVIRLAITESDLPGGARGAVLDVKPLLMPYKYAGNSRPWSRSGGYSPFYAYDVVSGTGQVIGEVPPFPFDSLDVPAFRDRLIVPVPDTPVSYPTPGPGV